MRSTASSNRTMVQRSVSSGMGALASGSSGSFRQGQSTTSTPIRGTVQRSMSVTATAASSSSSPYLYGPSSMSNNRLVQRTTSARGAFLSSSHASHNSSLLPVTMPLPTPAGQATSPPSPKPLQRRATSTTTSSNSTSSLSSSSHFMNTNPHYAASQSRKALQQSAGVFRNIFLLIAVTSCVVTFWSSAHLLHLHHDSSHHLGINSRGLEGASAAAGTTGAAAASEKEMVPPPPIVDKLPKNMPEKEPILQLLRDAGILDLDEATLERLPKWADVVALYGEKPIIYGLDTCHAFQTQFGDAAEHFLSVAGTFNSGTNVLAELLIHNCHMPARMAKYGKVHEGIRWQVPWGKHTPIRNDGTTRHGHKVASAVAADINADHVFPAVTIRDPAVWASSMCRHEYGLDWPHSQAGAVDQHCPNFVPNAIDVVLDAKLSNAHSVPVTAKYAEFEEHHDSLIHHWNDYYRAYYKQPTTATESAFPRVMVRFEDLIFHPKTVVQQVCECAGGRLKHEHSSDGKGFTYIVNSAKKAGGHGQDQTGYVEAIIKYGNAGPDRWTSGGMTADDRRFALDHLDRELMETFGYQHPTMLEENNAASAIQ